MGERVWYYAEGPTQMGPVTLEELAEVLRRLPAGALVWREGLGAWTPVEGVPELQGLRPPRPVPPPLPPRGAEPPPAPRRSGDPGMKVVLVVVVLVVLFFVAIPVIGIIAAIAIPSLLRARVSANEAAAIGDVRTVISAQAAYQASHPANLYAGRAECLTEPVRCIPGYDGPSFVDAALFQPARSGYRRELVGNGAEAGVGAFAFIALPFQEGRTGIRSFCGDATGIVCATTAGAKQSLLEPTDGGVKCSSACTPLH